MSKNPLINGLVASAYIFLVVTVMTVGSKFAPKEDNFLMPVAAISMFTLSAAVMGYIFGYQPAELYFGNKKKEAVKLFLQTVAAFASITLVILVLVFSRLLY